MSGSNSFPRAPYISLWNTNWQRKFLEKMLQMERMIWNIQENNFRKFSVTLCKAYIAQWIFQMDKLQRFSWNDHCHQTITISLTVMCSSSIFHIKSKVLLLSSIAYKVVDIWDVSSGNQKEFEKPLCANMKSLFCFYFTGLRNPQSFHLFL